MKLLLDMGLAQSTARYLRTLGHDAIHLREQGLQRLDDQLIVAKALREDRIIVTHDLDFGASLRSAVIASPASSPSGWRTCGRSKSTVTCKTSSVALPMSWARVPSSVPPNKRCGFAVFLSPESPNAKAALRALHVFRREVDKTQH